jgi:hypothetical protein
MADEWFHANNGQSMGPVSSGPARVAQGFDDEVPRGRRPVRVSEPSDPGSNVKLAVFWGVVFVLFIIAAVGITIIAATTSSQPLSYQADFGPQGPAIKGNQRGGGAQGTRSYTVTLNEPDDQHVQAITFQEGEMVNITVTTTHWAGPRPDVDLLVDGPIGEPIVEDEGDSKDCSVSFVAPQTGRYRVIVRLFSGSRITATVRY